MGAVEYHVGYLTEVKTPVLLTQESYPRVSNVTTLVYLQVEPRCPRS